MLDEGNPMSRRNDGTRDAPNAARVARARDAPTDGAAHVVDGAGGRGNGGSEGRPREKKRGHTQTQTRVQTNTHTNTRTKKNYKLYRTSEEKR